MTTQRVDLAGRVYGFVTVIGDAEAKPGKRRLWCRCKCGREFEASAANIKTGHTQSCGCLRRGMWDAGGPNKKHGQSKTGTYRVWRAMVSRCHNPRVKSYQNYGGRGITVCQRWRDSYEAFVSDMGLPQPGMQIDRVDNNGNYTPGNCRWTTPRLNSRNRRTSRLLTHDGRTQTAAAWAEEFGIRAGVIYLRIGRGWSDSAAITTPVMKSRKPRAVIRAGGLADPIITGS